MALPAAHLQQQANLSEGDWRSPQHPKRPKAGTFMVGEVGIEPTATRSQGERAPMYTFPLYPHYITPTSVCQQAPKGGFEPP